MDGSDEFAHVYLFCVVKSVKHRRDQVTAKQLHNRVNSPLMRREQNVMAETQLCHSNLILSHSGVTPQQIQPILRVLRLASTLRKLDLSGNLLDDDAVAELVHALITAQPPVRLEDLDLSHNPALTWRCTEAVSILLGSRDDEAMARLKIPLKTTSKKFCEGLKRLGLSCDRIGDKGISQLFDSLRMNATLQVTQDLLAEPNLTDTSLLFLWFNCYPPKSLTVDWLNLLRPL